jgi:hypothetical protein
VVRGKAASSCSHYVVPGGEDRGVIHVSIRKFGDFEKWMSMCHMEELVKLARTCHGAGPEYTEEFRKIIQLEGYVQRKAVISMRGPVVGKILYLYIHILGGNNCYWFSSVMGLHCHSPLLKCFWES